MSDKIEDIGLITEEIVDMLRAKTKAVADNLDNNDNIIRFPKQQVS